MMSRMFRRVFASKKKGDVTSETGGEYMAPLRHRSDHGATQHKARAGGVLPDVPFGLGKKRYSLSDKMLCSHLATAHVTRHTSDKGPTAAAAPHSPRPPPPSASMNDGPRKPQLFSKGRAVRDPSTPSPSQSNAEMASPSLPIAVKPSVPPSPAVPTVPASVPSSAGSSPYKVSARTEPALHYYHIFLLRLHLCGTDFSHSRAWEARRKKQPPATTWPASSPARVAPRS